MSSSGSSGPGQVLDTSARRSALSGTRSAAPARPSATRRAASARPSAAPRARSPAASAVLPARSVTQARSVAGSATQMISENALAAGAIAVAAGAAIGLILPATETERRVMGDAGTKAIDTAKSTVSDTLSKAESAPPDRSARNSERPGHRPGRSACPRRAECPSGSGRPVSSTSTGVGACIGPPSRARELETYAAHFDTVELNVTFYRMPPSGILPVVGDPRPRRLPLRGQGEPLPHPHPSPARPA